MTIVKTEFTFESQWVKWKQNWNFRTFKIRKVELLHHLRTSPTVPAMSDGEVGGQMADFLIPWLTEHSSLWPMSPLSSLCRMETAPGFSPLGLVMPHCGTSCWDMLGTFVFVQINRISDSSCKKSSLRSSMSQVEAEFSAHSKFTKSSCCITYAHCQLSQQCPLETF